MSTFDKVYFTITTLVVLAVLVFLNIPSETTQEFHDKCIEDCNCKIVQVYFDESHTMIMCETTQTN